MKRIKCLLLLSVVLSFVSCTEIHFEQPQPNGKKEILKIPKKYMGTYYYGDSTIKVDDDTVFAELFSPETGLPVLEIYNVLSIYPQMVTQGYDGKFIFNKQQAKVVDEMNWNADTIAKMFSVKRELIKTIREKGNLIYHYKAMDTLINLSRGDVVKNFKGYLFLNKNDDEDGWIVYRIKKKNKNLLFYSINDDDKKLLKTICPKEKDKHFNPTVKQFKLFLKRGGFQKKEVYLQKPSSKSN